ncbi:phosphotransferase enzyme family protein [Frigidibacter sp.]|uniref:phosphotransferase enzyme family protein n=1 Tax=Frigidibacter sp. TaxID=2586418 RepID=UPI0027367CB7|nr:phosphotransferase [Frigidibacter sp.]MDP3341050.1 phosphotransferase [Frigidibacter sp.]
MTRPPDSILSLWGVTAPLERLTGGHRNAAWRTRGQGRELVVKSTRRSEAALVWLGGMMEAAEAAGFAVPRLIASGQGRLIEDGWTCEPFLEGRPFAPADLAGIAGRIEGMHRRTAAMPQRPGFVGAVDLAGGAEAGGDVDLRAMPVPLADACQAAWGALRGLTRAGIHGDLGPGNLLWSASGQPALLDWDEARVDAVLFDTGQCGADVPAPISRALLAWEIACCWQVEPERATGLAAGFIAGA